MADINNSLSEKKGTLDLLINTIKLSNNPTTNYRDKGDDSALKIASEYVLPLNSYGGNLFAVFDAGNGEKIHAPLGFYFPEQPNMCSVRPYKTGDTFSTAQCDRRDVLYLPLKLSNDYVSISFTGGIPDSGSPYRTFGIEGKNGLHPLVLLVKKGTGYQVMYPHIKGREIKFCYKTIDTLPLSINSLESHFSDLPLIGKLPEKKEPKIIKKEEDIDWKSPKSIVRYLDQYVMGQEDAKKTLAVAFSNYMIRKDTDNEKVPKNSILLIGQSGVGKTYMVSLLAKKANLPMETQTLTGKSSEGLVGENLSSFWRGFRQKTKEEAPYGIVFFDEVDKLVEQNSNGSNIKQNLQETLIGWVEEATLNFQKGSDGSNLPPLNTKNVMFVFAGAFNGYAGQTDKLLKIIQKRKNPQKEAIGFSERSEHAAEVTLHDVCPQDVVEYGFMNELVGRMTSIAALNPLSIEDKVNILNNSKDSILERYTDLINTRGYDISIDKGVASLIAKACPPNTGARALKSICDKLFTSIIYDLEDYSDVNNHIYISNDIAEKIISA